MRLWTEKGSLLREGRGVDVKTEVAEGEAHRFRLPAKDAV